MDPLRVTFLGTGTSTGIPVPTCDCAVCGSDDPRDKRLRPSVRLEWRGASVLIDTATDLREQALRYGIDRIDAVLYTHAHADHVLGLDELRLYNWRQGGPIPAYGSAHTLACLGRSFWYVFEDVPDGGGKPAIERVTVDAPFDVLGRRVVPVAVEHGTLPILGFRIGCFAYLTDVSAIPPSSLEALEGLEVLVLSALRDRPHPTHQTIDEACALAARIGATHTWLTHMNHEVGHASTEARLPPRVRLAWDGLVLEVEGRP